MRPRGKNIRHGPFIGTKYVLGTFNFHDQLIRMAFTADDPRWRATMCHELAHFVQYVATGTGLHLRTLCDLLNHAVSELLVLCGPDVKLPFLLWLDRHHDEVEIAVMAEKKDSDYFAGNRMTRSLADSTVNSQGNGEVRRRKELFNADYLMVRFIDEKLSEILRPVQPYVIGVIADSFPRGVSLDSVRSDCPFTISSDKQWVNIHGRQGFPAGLELILESAAFSTELLDVLISDAQRSAPDIDQWDPQITNPLLPIFDDLADASMMNYTFPILYGIQKGLSPLFAALFNVIAGWISLMPRPPDPFPILAGVEVPKNTTTPGFVFLSLLEGISDLFPLIWADYVEPMLRVYDARHDEQALRHEASRIDLVDLFDRICAIVRAPRFSTALENTRSDLLEQAGSTSIDSATLPSSWGELMASQGLEVLDKMTTGRINLLAPYWPTTKRGAPGTIHRHGLGGGVEPTFAWFASIERKLLFGDHLACYETDQEYLDPYHCPHHTECVSSKWPSTSPLNFCRLKEHRRICELMLSTFGVETTSYCHGDPKDQ